VEGEKANGEWARLNGSNPFLLTTPALFILMSLLKPRSNENAAVWKRRENQI